MTRRSEEVARRQQLTEVRASEAVALFEANQSARTAIEKIVGLFLSIAAGAGTVAAATDSADAVLPLPALLLLLLSYMFQEYSDLTVLGRARLRLEDLVNADLGGQALIYESKVADIRKEAPLVGSVRVLQILLGMIAIGTTVGGSFVAYESGDIWIKIGYAAGTFVALMSAVYSGWHMLKTPAVADRLLRSPELGFERALWVSSNLHREVTEQVRREETTREAAERLLVLGLSRSR